MSKKPSHSKVFLILPDEALSDTIHQIGCCCVFSSLTPTINLIGDIIFMEINPKKDRTKRETINGLHRGLFES